jgi:RNA recognition motif-containing protein
MSVRLYVGNLPKESVERQSLQDIFLELGDTITIKVIKDRKTNKCRGFAFVTVPTDEIADQFIGKYNGLIFLDNPLKIEKALPRVKGKGKEEGEEEVVLETTSVAEESEKTAETVKTLTPERPKAPLGEHKQANKKQRSPRGQQRTGYSSTLVSSEAEGVQPDPRWASELSKLKDLLSSQAVNL